MIGLFAVPDPGFGRERQSRVGGRGLAIIWHNFGWKLHKNEKQLDWEGRAVPRPLHSPLFCCTYEVLVLNSRQLGEESFGEEVLVIVGGGDDIYDPTQLPILIRDICNK